jgi:predicted phage tail protein
MQQVVRLLGDLGERYGAEHTYTNLRTPAEAIKLLCINHPELQEELVHAHEYGIGYRLIQAEQDLGYEDLPLPLGSNDLILTPVVAGSGGTVGRILAGVGLVAFAILTAGAGAGFLGLGAGLTAGTFTLGAAASTAIGAIGTSLILGGITQMLSPQPTLPTLGSSSFGGLGGGGNRLTPTQTDGPQSIVRGTDGRQSYAYTGAANTIGVGATIPVAYGEVLIGSHLLSANVEVTDESDPLQTTIKDPGPDTVLFGGEKITGVFSSASGVDVRRIYKNYTVAGYYYRITNKTIVPTRGRRQYLGEIFVDQRFKDQVDVSFELNTGLFDYVSGVGSTKVDGYISYKIEIITVPNFEAPWPVTGTSQGTIQGLLLPGQTYRWVHRLSYAPITNDLALYFYVEIIDSRLHSSCRLFVNAYGYNLP